MMKHLFKLFLFCSLISTNYTFGQFTTRTHSNYFLTPEIGATFTDADVSTRTSIGFGLKFGYTFAKYRIVEFDIRARYYGGQWLGQNKRNSDLTDYITGIYSNPETDYKNTLGYTVRNFKTENHNLAFEGLLRFNVDTKRVFAPYIFGGIASSIYYVNTNLLDADGFMYQYEAGHIPLFKSEYDKIQDKTYETPVYGSRYISSLTGNVGIGFSLNVTDGVRVGLEHTMSFTKKDNFDGYEADKAFTKNDVYHFTSFYIQFYLRGKKQKQNDPKPTPSTTNPTTNNTPSNPCTTPSIRMLRPSTQGETVEDGRYEIASTVSGVTNKNDITLTVNDRQINDFNFNTNNGRVTSLQSLNYGTNTITISARNACGNDIVTTSVIYEQRNLEPPVVYFTNPAANPYTSNTDRFNLVAKALNVDRKENIVFRQNGSLNNNFSFNTTTKDFTSYVVLQNGNNIFEITGTNKDGTASATTIIIYGRTVNCQNPIISLKQPNRKKIYTSESNYTVIGSAFNVDNQNQLVILVNNQKIPYFTFNLKDKTFSAGVSLREGANTVTISATNNCGTTNQSVTIVYSPSQEASTSPPTVTFITPYQSNTTVNSSNYTFVATTSYISSPNQIKINFNGNTVSGFSFDVKNQQISFATTLIDGNNSATINVTNNDGSASTITTVLYRARTVAPAVQFTNPGISPTTVNGNNYNVIAKTINVTTKNQISLYVNGNKTTLFNFNAASSEVSYNAVLQEGSNDFKITVLTNGGSASDQTTLIYKKRSVIVSPTVNFTSPMTNIEVKNNSYNLIAQTANVDRAEQISISKNGNAIQLFSFDASTQQIRFSSLLSEGKNTFKVNVSTDGGTAQDEVIITYNKEVFTPNPTVKWTSPANSGTTVLAESYDFSAKTTTVNSKNAISITLNNKSITDFNFNATTGTVTFNGKLVTGNNTAIIQVSNESGNASDATSITSRKITFDCLKPVIKLDVNELTKTVPSNYTLKGSISNITSAQEIQLFVNGTKDNTPITFNSTNHTFSANLNLSSGSNVVELKATNKCGLTSAFTTLNVAVCYPPELVLISPSQRNPNTDAGSMKIEFGAVNVTSKGQLSMKVNGKVQAFTFDAINSRVNANISLMNGNNKVELIAQNDCGSVKNEVTIVRNECKKPEITIVNSSVANNGTTTNQYFSLNAKVSYINNNNQVSVTNNGRPVNFVYNNSSNTLALDVSSQTGVNTVIIKLSNNCGSISYTHTYTCQEDPNAKPPVLTFVNPSSQISVDEPTYNFSLTTKYITSKGQLAVKVNGQTVNFNFNESSKVISFTGSLKEGSNTAQVYAVTPYGSDEKTAVVNYKKQITVAAPTIVITSHTCPIQLSLGVNTISGYITNVESTSNVKFYINNVALSNVTTSISGNKIVFSYTVTARANSASQTLKITAQNSAKTETKTCIINYPTTSSGGMNSPIITTPKTTKVTPPKIKTENKSTSEPAKTNGNIRINTQPTNTNASPRNIRIKP